jgi:hypothetical protein
MFKAKILNRVFQGSIMPFVLFICILITSQLVWAQNPAKVGQERSVTVVLDASKSMCAYYGQGGKYELDQVMGYLEGVVGDYVIQNPQIYELSSTFKTYSSFQDEQDRSKRNQLKQIKDRSMRQYTLARCPSGANAFPESVIDDLLINQNKGTLANLIYVSDAIMPDVAMRNFSASAARWLNSDPKINRLEIMAIRAQFNGRYYREEPNSEVYEIREGTRPLYVFWFYSRPWPLKDKLLEALQARLSNTPTAIWTFGPWFLDVNKTNSGSSLSPKTSLNQIESIGSNGSVFNGKEDCVFVSPDNAAKDKRAWSISIQTNQGSCKKQNISAGFMRVPYSQLLPTMDEKKFLALRVESCESRADKTEICTEILQNMFLDIPIPSSGQTASRTVKAIVVPQNSIDWKSVAKNWSSEGDACSDRNSKGVCSIVAPQAGKDISQSAKTNLERDLSRTLRVENMFKAIEKQSKAEMQKNWVQVTQINVTAK